MRRIKIVIPKQGHRTEPPLEINDGETKIRLLPIESKIYNLKLVLENAEGQINQIGIYDTKDFSYTFKKKFVKFYLFWEETEIEYHLQVEIS